MNKLHFVVAVTVLSISGCRCDPGQLRTAKGVVQWEWQTSEGPQVDTKATIDFGTISMGARSDAALIVRNAGTGTFSMTEFAQLDGSPVAINGKRPEGTDFPAFTLTFDATAELQPTESTTVSVSFTPPVVVEPFVDHIANLELRPDRAEFSTLSLKGRAVSDSCDLPDSIDFGALPLGVTSENTLTISNNSAIASTFTAGAVADVPADTYFLLGLENGQLQVPSGGSSTLTLRFSPTEPRDYNGTVPMRRGASCPEKNVQLLGRGVTSCLSWVPSPTDTSGTILSYGSVPPGSVKEGLLTLQNACSVVVNVSNIRTNDQAFKVNSANALTVPAATRNEDGTWAAGTAVVSIDFEPTGFGAKQGLLLAATDLEAQANFTVGLKAFGGGPIIRVVPDPTLAFGRVGFTPGATPALVATRQLRITNIGNQVAPTPDPLLNLRLDGQPFSITATSGERDELCVGDFDAVSQVCTPGYTSAYPTNGIAPGTTGLNLPVRLIPKTAGAKSFELIIYSNDYATPEKHITITAEAIEAPPCDYTATPTTLDFGLVNSTASLTQSFTLRNNGTQPTDVCYFSGFDLSTGTDPAFSIVTPPTDLELAPGAEATITVQLTPVSAPAVATPITGAVVFSVPTAAGYAGQVNLQATLSPSCLSISPVPVNFGDVKQGCSSAERSIIINNSCQTPVTYSGAVLTEAAVAPNGTGACTDAGGCPQFSLVSVPAAATIPAGGQRVITVRFRPQSQATFNGNVRITLQTTGPSFNNDVPLVGNGVPPPASGVCVSASCPPPQTVGANTRVSLPVSIVSQGANSCGWSVQSRPTTSSGAFTNPTSCGPTPVTTYDADTVGVHDLRFSVTSGGETITCNTPITVVPNGDLWAELTWQYSGSRDMDFYMAHPAAGLHTNATAWDNGANVVGYADGPGTACNGGQANPQPHTQSWGIAGTADDGNLDRDDCSGPGPENLRIQTPQLNTAYAIGVHYFSGGAGAVSNTIRLYCGGALVTTETRSMSNSDDFWVFGTVSFPGGGLPCQFSSTNGLILTGVNP